MSTLACLVEVEGSELKRKFQFNDAHVVTLTRLKDAVKQCSLLSENLSCTGATATFKLYDKDFDCFVTIADDDVIPHLSTVRLTPGTNVQPQPTEKELTLTQLLSCSNLEMQQPSMSSAVPEKTNDIEDRDGKAYDLPDFGWLHGSLLMVANGEPLTSSLEIKIVEFLYQSVMPFTLYPSRVFYYKVISLFLERYPHLADSIGSGFSDVHTASQHEDETSIERHEQWLRSEGKKTDPDEFQIKVRMAATTEAELQTSPLCL
ncbi:uncharacterized protein LOC135391371 [Ornithodoros turicata]|uniref:uncharacterized protein LOC135391371 n=1 Tax=Ornithodoros turicata TaxID=34597 RepID=UPI0031398B1D